MSRLALAFVTCLTLLLIPAPAPAHAAEGFLGVLEDGRMVRFSSQEPFALSTPRRPVGLAPGERLVAVSAGPHGPVGVGSSARLYALDPESGRATAIGAPFEPGLRGSRFALAAAPGATTARLLSDVGQDLVVDLETGVAQQGPGLTNAADGSALRPAADVGADGRLVGVQLGHSTFVRETSPGSSTMDASRLALPYEPKLTEPIGFQIGSDGKGYLLGVAGGNIRSRQSILVLVDPVTGTVEGGRERARTFFMSRRLNAFASLGRVAEDRTKPRVIVRLPRTISVRALLARGLPLSVKVNEAAQVTATIYLGGRWLGFGFKTRDTPGVVVMRERLGSEFYDNILLSARARAILRGAVGRRVLVSIRVTDLKSNGRQFARTARLTR